MKTFLSLICIAVIFCPAFLYSQEAGTKEPDKKRPGETEQDNPSGTTGKDKDKKSANFNVDAMVLYGQYNRLLWTGSLTQSFKDFTYQLNSKFSRSGDFGYRHSGYYDNEIGFTGEADITSKWKMTPEVEVGNESHGMFRNPFYNSEEKDRVVLKINNDISVMPMKWSLNIGGVYFNHRLDGTWIPDRYSLEQYHSSDFYKANAEFGWQYVVSANNKLSFNSKFSYYFFKHPYDYDSWVANELIWNFNISEYFKFGLGPQYTYNRDRGHFVSGRIEAATLKIKYFSAGASYVYELVPFTPENYYFDRRFVRPEYNQLPGKGHHADLSIGVDVNNSSDRAFYLKKLKVKATGSFVTNDRFYAPYSIPEGVLATHVMKVQQARARCEAALGLAIYTAYLELGGKYEYVYSYASDYVTYQPDHQGSGYIRLNVWRFETEFSTGYRDRMQASPFCSVTMGPALTGALSLQVQVLESLFLFGRIDNIYNSRYSVVYPYPEQGRTVIGGLRAVL